MFIPTDYDKKFLITPNVVDLPESKYMVNLIPSTAREGETYYKVIGIHHLLPVENKGNRNVFITVLDENGNRVKAPFYAGWTWKDRQAHERADPVLLDKPSNEAMGNISVGSNQVVTIWIKGKRIDDNDLSDTVSNLHTLHADERGPNGETWNSIGHHSFYVVFQKTKKVITVPPVEPPVDPDEVPDTSELTTNDLKTIRFAKEYANDPWPFAGSNFLLTIAKLAKMLKL